MSRAIRRFGGDALMGLYETSEMADSTNLKYNITEEGDVQVIN